MGIRKIIKKGDISLKKKSRPVTEYNARLKILLDDMRDTLSEANGVGLAAPQVGVLRRAVLVADFSGEEPVIYELVNPENSRMLAGALNALHIPCRLEIGPTGGHGFADGSGMCMAGWTERAARWADSLP